MVLGVMIFFEDGPELLERSLSSLKKVTDRVLAIDGAYREFPHKDFKSSAECIKVVKSLADELIIPENEWHDEPQKRNAYLKLKSKKDYYLMIDADEVIEGKKPDNLKYPVYRVSLGVKRAGAWLPGYYNRLFRHHTGMRYHLKHNNLILQDGTSLSIPEDHIPIIPDLQIIHKPEDRPQSRQEQDGVFETTKEERLVVLPNQVTPGANMSEIPIKLRYLGLKPYHGYDSIGGSAVPIHCNQGDIIYVSPEKEMQLSADFPESWLILKDVKNG